MASVLSAWAERIYLGGNLNCLVALRLVNRDVVYLLLFRYARLGNGADLPP